MKTPLLAIALLVTVLLAGCSKSGSKSSSGAPAAKVRIGFLVKQPEEPWFQHEWRFADEAGRKLGCDIIKIGAADGEKVLAAIDNLAAQGAQGFIICTPDVRLGPAIAAKAKANHLKLMSVDDQFIGADGKFMDVPHMGISARKIGNLVGQSLADEMKRRGWKPEETAAMGITLVELDTARERTDGAAEALVATGFPKDRVFVGPLRGLAEVSTAFDAANIVLTQHADIKHWLVFGMNDESVLGGVRALEGRGFMAENTIGIGIGGSTGMVDWQKEKPTGFFAAVLISPRRHGYETTELMYKWITQRVAPPPATYTTGILIDRSNYKQIMTDQGLL